MMLVAQRGRHITLTGVDARTDEPYVTRAFLPAPLPTDPDLSSTTWGAVTAAHVAIARLTELLARRPQLRPLVARREAVASLGLAGDRQELEDLLVAEVLGELDDQPRQLVEAIDQVGTPGLGDTHDVRVRALASAVLGRTAPLRDGPGWVAAPDAGIDRASYVAPPPGGDLDAAVDAWATWARTCTLPAVVAGALSHVQLDAVRPWEAGTGRIGRLALLDRVASAEGGTLVPVSTTLLRDEDDYLEVLARTRVTPSLDPWVLVIASSLRDAATATRRWVLDVERAIDALVAEVEAAGVRGTALAAARDLGATPVTTVRGLADRHDVAFQTANVAVERLVERGALVQLNHGRYDRVFGCPGVLAA